MKIKYDSLFTKNIVVDEQKALELAKFLFTNITTMNDNEKVDYINNVRFKGIKFTLEQMKKEIKKWKKSKKN